MFPSLDSVVLLRLAHEHEADVRAARTGTPRRSAGRSSRRSRPFGGRLSRS